MPSLVQRHLLRRGARLWLAARLIVMGLVMWFQGDPIAIGSPATLAVIAVTVMLGFADAQRLSERVLLANLGLSLQRQVLLLGSAAACGEIVLRVGAAFA